MTVSRAIRATIVSLTALFGVYGCADNTSRTTTIKKETKIDDDGNQKTKIETKTVEQSNTGPVRDNETTVEVKKSDPLVKVGPLEIK